ncbi:MAG: hypothetical protein ACOC22_01760 [bacterium]
MTKESKLDKIQKEINHESIYKVRKNLKIIKFFLIPQLFVIFIVMFVCLLAVFISNLNGEIVSISELLIVLFPPYLIIGVCIGFYTFIKFTSERENKK